MSTSGAEPPHAVHGMALEEVEPDWPPLTDNEIHALFERVGAPLAGLPPAEAKIVWHSPRPFSAAALVRLSGAGTIVVKRHHVNVRDAVALAREHDFMSWLAERGQPVARPLAPPLEEGPYSYEILATVPGEDRYRNEWSWTPFLSRGDAAAAGRALARVHLAAEGYDAPARTPAPLFASQAVITAPDPVDAIAALAAERPALGDYLARHEWRDELAEDLSTAHDLARPHLEELHPLWAHNDWHGSNLFWTPGTVDPPEVTGIIDFGLCNRTSAVYDLATAIERSCIGWLQPAGARPVHVDQATALIAAYRSVRPLAPGSLTALDHVLPIVHVEYALSEIDYFHGVVASGPNADLAYRDFLIGHLRWFTGEEGRAFRAAIG